MRILTDCDNCGHVVGIEPRAASLVVFRPSAHRRPLAGRLRFECPDCGAACETEVGAREESRLADCGVPIDLRDDPRDRHPSAHRGRPRADAVLTAPAFTEEDVLELDRLLSREDWFDLLLDAR